MNLATDNLASNIDVGEKTRVKRILISFLIFSAPFSMGPIPLIGTYSKFIMLIIGTALFLINFEDIFGYRKKLPLKYTFFTIWFGLSFFASLWFGLEYKNLTSYTLYDSTYSGVFLEIVTLIPIQLFLIYNIYISIEDLDDLFFYIKIFLYSGFIVNSLAILAIIGNFGYDQESRLSVTFDDPNYLGRFEVFFIMILLIFLFFNHQVILTKIFYIGNAVLGLIIILFSSSRAALLTFVAVASIVILFKKSKLIKVGFISLNFLLFSYLIVTIASRRGVFASGGSTSVLTSFLDISNTTRIALNYASVSMFLDHPIFGIGYRNFYNIYINQSYVPDFIPVALHVSIVHSWLFSILAELGLFGTIPFCILLFIFFKHLLKNIVKPIDSNYKLIALIFFSVLSVFIINGLFFPVFFPETMFALIFGLSAGFIKLTGTIKTLK